MVHKISALLPKLFRTTKLKDPTLLPIQWEEKIEYILGTDTVAASVGGGEKPYLENGSQQQQRFLYVFENSSRIKEKKKINPKTQKEK